MVGVALQGERRRRVAGERLEVADGLAALGEQGETAMPHIVEAHSRETGPLQQGLEVPVDDVLSFEGTAREVGEDEAVIVPLGTAPQLLLKLALPVASEGTDGPLRKSYGPAAGVLRLGEFELAGLLSVTPDALQLAVHPERARLKVYVGPLQT